MSAAGHLQPTLAARGAAKSPLNSYKGHAGPQTVASPAPVQARIARIRASRITYVGELGFEIYIPAEIGLHVFDTLWQGGLNHGLTPAGFHTLSNCRIEKGYRTGAKTSATKPPPAEAGLAFAVALTKPDFIGRGPPGAIGRRARFATRMVNLALLSTDVDAPWM